MSKQHSTAAERTTTLAPGDPRPQPDTPTPAVPLKRVPQDVEVVPTGKRRSYTAAYKRAIVKKADACQGDGDIGKLLRTEGLYSSHLTTWRREIEARELSALEPRKRGPKPLLSEMERENAELRKENARLRVRAERAELVAEIEKKVNRLLESITANDGTPG